MTARTLKSLLHQLRSASRKCKLAGFTLIELLVGMIIASLVTSGLMYIAVQLLETDQKESAQTETQADLQSALDFISSELREAVYVYGGECLQGQGVPTPTNPNSCPGIIKHIINTPDNSVPILAFWKLDPLPFTLREQCKATPTPTNLPCPAGKTYSLVVYFLRKNQQIDAPNWLGKARITRYELTQYASDGTKNQAHVAPDQAGVGFQIWPYRNKGGIITNLQYSTPTADQSNPAVLVDFIDDTVRAGDSDINSTGCPTNYELTPSTTNAPFINVRSFYACVRKAAKFNQDVFIFLRGNALGKGGVSNDSFFPTLQTQVPSRGVVEKVPLQ